MYVSGALLLLCASSISGSILPSGEYPFPSFYPAREGSNGFRIPTVHESAIQARRILRLETIGTLSTVFPSSSPLGGAPIGLMDYYADCEDTGNPTILALSIATSFKNVAAGSNITMSLRWHPPNLSQYSAASMQRFSLVGHLENMSEDEGRSVTKCFTRAHRDAAAWLPGNRIHESHWTRLIVDEIYWIGGFGDRAYIGWIPVEQWGNVTEQEIDSCKLPGEKRWSLW